MAADGCRAGQLPQALRARRGPRHASRNGRPWQPAGCPSWTTWSGRWSTPRPTPTPWSRASEPCSQQAVGVLADLGYPRRDDNGRAFDPALHEAVSTVSGEGLVPGTVAQVVRPGYGPDDKILRPAAVVVATRAILMARTSTRSSESPAMPTRPTSSGPTAGWRASTTPTSTRTPRPRSGSRRSPRPTTCCRIPSCVAATTPSVRTSDVSLPTRIRPPGAKPGRTPSAGAGARGRWSSGPASIGRLRSRRLR